MRNGAFWTAVAAVTLTGTAMGQQSTVIVDELRSVSPKVDELTFTCPPFSVEHQVRLSLLVRIDWRDLAGSNHWLRVAVNGTWLTVGDLLNKRNEFTLVRGTDLLWGKGDRWRVLYSPDFQQALDPARGNAAPKDDPYRFVWDITRYVKPGENQLKLDHLQVLAKPDTMVIGQVAVEVGRPISPPSEETVEPAPTGPLTDYLPAPPARQTPAVKLTGPRTIEVSVGGRRCVVETRTSLPAKRWDDSAGTVDGLSASWGNERYRVQRKVTVVDQHVHVADTLTNQTKDLVGVMVEHTLQPTGAPRAVRLSGSPVTAESSASLEPTHPAAWIEWPDGGLGLVAEDDVFRIHSRVFREGESIGLADRTLGLAPNASVTLEWSLYPLPGGDYWTFVNAVRRAWDVNFTIPGPFVFVGGSVFRGKPAEWVGDWTRKRGLKIVCGGIAKYATGKYAHGTGILFAPEFVADEKDWIGKLKATAPQLTPVCYFHSFCCTEPDGETKYADARMLDFKGEHLGYPYSYRLLLYVPTRENSYGKALWGYVKCLLDDIGAAGIYWDEMSHSVPWYVPGEPWDGVTARIDPATHELAGTMTSVPLLSQPLRLDIVRHVRERGKFLMGNTQAATRTMMREKVVRFVETGSYSALDATHLACPLGLGNHDKEDSTADTARLVRRLLDHGTVYYGHYYYHEPPAWSFIPLMYPITPVELREGVVIGQERILTARSGRFGWPDGAAAEVYVIDPEGNRVTDARVKDVVEAGRHRYEIRMPSNQFAILVRR